MKILKCQPIGFFHSPQSEKYMAARQATLGSEMEGKVILCPNQDFEQALADLKGFERIWLIYWFDRNTDWKPKVQTPRQGPKRGVFATRAPHRPNPLGLSCVELKDVIGRELLIGKNDLLDGTPILDIKPYLSYADAFPDSKEGWTEEERPQSSYEVKWEDKAQRQALFIEQHTPLKLRETVNLRLRENPLPFPSHRIKSLGDNRYELALKTWRIHYAVVEQQVIISDIASGYDSDTLQGKKSSRWDDVPVHIAFLKAEG